MKQRVVNYFLFFLTLLSAAPSMASGPSGPTCKRASDEGAFERSDPLATVQTFIGSGDTVTGTGIVACTDRTTYIAGENIQFALRCYPYDPGVANIREKIVYCELLTPGGTKLIGRKYALDQNKGQGILPIPPETISGNYFIRFYTRFMRNGSPSDYAWSELKIVNPFKQEILKPKLAADSLITGSVDQSQPAHELSLQLSVSSAKASPRENMRLNLHADRNDSSQFSLCLTVIPEHTCNTQFTSQPARSLRQPDYKHSSDTLSINQPQQRSFNLMPGVAGRAAESFFIPETRGISISGQLVTRESKTPVPSTMINLSVIGDMDIEAVRTDSSGRFIFALNNHYGLRDIFMCADVPDENPTEILINNDFCSKPVNLSSSSFRLNPDERMAAYKMAVNLSVATSFQTETPEEDTIVRSKKSSFYGEPTDVLLMDKYIEMPTLEEYFSELPMIVKVRKSQGRKQFRFMDASPEMAAASPLVLVDWVAINDMKKVLAMSPHQIERIELVSSTYIKGNLTYGGIISFISKGNDFAGIDLPGSGTFINYRFLEKGTAVTNTSSIPENIPDARNTVFWDPDVSVDLNGNAEISFSAPDTPGKYLVIMRALKADGSFESSQAEFTVTND